MDALLTTFVAAALAEWGDRTQLFMIILAARFARPGPLLAGLAVAALANNLLAAFGGTLVHDTINAQALSLLVALSLILAALAGLRRRKPPNLAARWRTGAFVTAAVALFLIEFGDKTQFLTFALAGRFDSLGLAAAGATAGVVAANVPAVLLGERLKATIPLQPVRYAIAAGFLVVGFIVAVNALDLA
jgi:putative Ca2+/H+ antiporter (TMEM165/GDT1 family)